MGEISDLRTQILDNVKTLNADYGCRSDLRFVVSCNEENGYQHWIVKLVIPALNAQNMYTQVLYIGNGPTMEAAYRDIVKRTAVKLFNRGY